MNVNKQRLLVVGMSSVNQQTTSWYKWLRTPDNSDLRNVVTTFCLKRCLVATVISIQLVTTCIHTHTGVTNLRRSDTGLIPVEIRDLQTQCTWMVTNMMVEFKHVSEIFSFKHVYANAGNVLLMKWMRCPCILQAYYIRFLADDLDTIDRLLSTCW